MAPVIASDPTVAAAPPAAAATREPSPLATNSASAVDAAHVAETPAPSLHPGDFVVYRFSGIRNTPLLLTERVVESSATAFVVDRTLDDGVHRKTTRARYTREAGAPSELVSAYVVDGERERQLTPGAFEAIMSATDFPVDSNSGEIGSGRAAIAIGGTTLDCAQKTYRVIVGGTQATMKTFTSATFPWGDVGGEIRAKDGKVLYRAEVVDAGNGGPELAASR